MHGICMEYVSVWNIMYGICIHWNMHDEDIRPTVLNKPQISTSISAAAGSGGGPGPGGTARAPGQGTVGEEGGVGRRGVSRERERPVGGTRGGDADPLI